MRYGFFKELKKEFGDELVRKIMSHLQVLRVQAGHVVFDQDEPGDKFYIILSGSASVDMAQAQDVEPLPRAADMSHKAPVIKAYLQALYDSFDRVLWSRVPYAIQVRDYLVEVQNSVDAFVQKIQKEILRKLAGNILDMFLWIKKRKQTPGRRASAVGAADSKNSETKRNLEERRNKFQ